MLAAIKAGIVYFAAVFAAGFLFGTIRVLMLTPHIGELHAVLIELPLMLVISWHVSRWLTVRADGLDALPPRLVMGGLAFGLLMFGEAGVATLGFGRTLAEHVASYATAPAAIGLAGQMAFAAFPAIQLLMKPN